MNFRTLRKSDMETIIGWRSTCPETLRTTKELTLENQLDFYENVISNRNSNARWWGIEVGNTLIGYCALENISWENRNAEISLLIDPKYQGKGYGLEATYMLLQKGFDFLNLDNIWGETYKCGAWQFWDKVVYYYKGYKTYLPQKKFWQGKYYDSMYFNISKENFYDANNS
jgi:RimJ/RimL family protein N-acetyltransferase